MERICSKCGEKHPVGFFNKDRTRPDGLYPQCKNCTRKNCRRVYRKNYDVHVKLKRQWKAENAEDHKRINREWRQNNPDKARAGTAAYRKRLARATPPWVDREELREFHQRRPEGHHVDHIIPLAGKVICGLNVPQNLQYLPAEVHMRKGTKFLASAGGYDHL